MNNFIVLDLFAGCGGLSYGFEQAGWKIKYAYEMWEPAVKAYNHNHDRICQRIKLSREFAFPDADIVIGGPPCQPFSVTGSQGGENDSRDGLKIFLQALRRCKPKYAVLENVANLARTHRPYLDIIIKEFEKLGYVVSWKVLNASDYGTPQNRKRLFIVLHQGDFSFPKPTAVKPLVVADVLPEYSFDPLTAEEHPELVLTASMDNYIARYEQKSKCKRPRDLHPELPSRTLTCRNLCGRTSDMIRLCLANGRRRELTVHEACLLSTFPADYFPDTLSRAECMKCIGNAVPPALAECIGTALMECASRVNDIPRG